MGASRKGQSVCVCGRGGAGGGATGRGVGTRRRLRCQCRVRGSEPPLSRCRERPARPSRTRNVHPADPAGAADAEDVCDAVRAGHHDPLVRRTAQDVDRPLEQARAPQVALLGWQFARKWGVGRGPGQRRGVGGGEADVQLRSRHSSIPGRSRRSSRRHRRGERRTWSTCESAWRRLERAQRRAPSRTLPARRPPRLGPAIVPTSVAAHSPAPQAAGQ